MVAALAQFADNASTANVLLTTHNVEMRVIVFSIERKQKDRLAASPKSDQVVAIVAALFRILRSLRNPSRCFDQAAIACSL
jgi:hypothetical protein